MISTVKMSVRKMIKPFEEKKLKMKSSKMMYGSTKYYKALGSNACFDTHPHYNGFRVVYCDEHRHREILPELNYACDLKIWYRAGKHPRFSITKFLTNQGQIPREIWGAMDGGAFNPLGKSFLKALKECKNESDLLSHVNPYLFTDLYWRRRKYRVTNQFKERYNKRRFRIRDFLRERNQELRRMMLSRGVSISRILKHMTFVNKDTEGELYAFGISQFLHVKCPSTGQEYLLEVPTRFTSPKVARRWTFNLPTDAQFVQEA